MTNTSPIVPPSIRLTLGLALLSIPVSLLLGACAIALQLLRTR